MEYLKQIKNMEGENYLNIIRLNDVRAYLQKLIIDSNSYLCQFGVITENEQYDILVKDNSVIAVLTPGVVEIFISRDTINKLNEIYPGIENIPEFKTIISETFKSDTKNVYFIDNEYRNDFKEFLIDGKGKIIKRNKL